MDVVIHLGLPKTGSCFLQKNIFPKLENCEAYGIFNKPFHVTTKFDENKINIISNEQYSGRPNTVMESAGRFEIAKRFHGMFPDAKIIVVFRDKKDWVESLYLEYLKSGRGTYEYQKWYDEIFDKDSLKFEEYEKYLKGLFKDVLVCQFEDLKSKPDEYIKNICDFIGVPVPKYTNEIINIRLTDKTVERWRKFNKLFYSRYCPHKGIFPEYLNPLMYFLRLLLYKKSISSLRKRKWI